MTALAAFIVAVATSWVLTPIVRRTAHGAGLLDEPEDRKVHEVPIPRLGGVAIGAGLYLGMAAALVAARLVGRPFTLETGHLSAILVGVALIGGVGLLDDLQGMRARVKLGAQLAVALIVFGLGLSIDRLTGPWGTIELGVWALPLTVFWIVAVMNAVNLIDGLDGLSSGVALTALAAFYIVGVEGGGNRVLLPVIAAGAGGVIGFLRYNLPPSSIIMGDTGSMLLGFLLGAIGISLTQGPVSDAPPWVPILAVGLPLADMIWAILRRVAAGAPVFAPDKRHIHHVLLERGLSHRAAVGVLWAISAMLCGLAVWLALLA